MLNKDKCLFRCANILFGDIISQQGMRLDQWNIQGLTDMPPSNT